MTNETINYFGHILFRIVAVKSFKDVKYGDFGGFIEKEKNLSHDGDSWIYDDSKVYGNAEVKGNACIRTGSCVYDNAKVYENATVRFGSEVYGNACIHGNAIISSNADFCYGTVKT